jgi:hypothetical protein
LQLSFHGRSSLSISLVSFEVESTKKLVDMVNALQDVC